MWAGDHDGAGREAHRHRRQICVVGGNAKAAKLSGIKTERLAFSDLREHGVLAALAGLGFELDVIAAGFMGEPPPRAFPDKIDHILSWPGMPHIRIGRSWSETKQWPRINYRRCTQL